MSIKVAMLKSGEDVISDIKEIFIGDNVVGYQIENPYTVRLLDKIHSLDGEPTATSEWDIFFSPWAPLSADKKFNISFDWVVTIYEPHEDVKNSYVNKMETNNEYSSSSID